MLSVGVPVMLVVWGGWALVQRQRNQQWQRSNPTANLADSWPPPTANSPPGTSADMDASPPYIIAGTGSRSFMPTDLARAWLHRHLTTTMVAHPDLELMSGYAEGWDEFIAREAIASGLPLHAAIPNRGYGRYYWGQHSLTGRDRLAEFNELLSHAKTVVYVCGNDVYRGGVHANFVRNQYLVDHANEFVVFGSTSRGTADCVRRIVLANKTYRMFLT